MGYYYTPSVLLFFFIPLLLLLILTVVVGATMYLFYRTYLVSLLLSLLHIIEANPTTSTQTSSSSSHSSSSSSTAVDTAVTSPTTNSNMPMMANHGFGGGDDDDDEEHGKDMQKLLGEQQKWKHRVEEKNMERSREKKSEKRGDKSVDVDGMDQDKRYRDLVERQRKQMAFLMRQGFENQNHNDDNQNDYNDDYNENNDDNEDEKHGFSKVEEGSEKSMDVDNIDMDKKDKILPFPEAESNRLQAKYWTRAGEGMWYIKPWNLSTTWDLCESVRQRFFLRAQSVDEDGNRVRGGSLVDGLIVSAAQTYTAEAGKADLLLKPGGMISTAFYSTKDHEILTDWWVSSGWTEEGWGIQTELEGTTVDWLPATLNINKPSPKFFYSDSEGLRAAKSSGWMACRWSHGAEISLFALKREMTRPLPPHCERVKLFATLPPPEEEEEDKFDEEEGVLEPKTKWGEAHMWLTKMPERFWQDMGYEKAPACVHPDD